MSISKTTWKDFIRRRIVLICLLLFIAGAWSCAEWKFSLADMASSLLIRFDEPPEYTRTTATTLETGKKKRYAPRETLRGLHQAQRQAGVLLVRSDTADRRIPVNPESPDSCRFIADTCLRDWAVTVADPQEAIPVCADGILPDGWNAYRFTEIKGDINVRRACPGVSAGKEIRLMTVLNAATAREHAKLLVKADGAVSVQLNGKTVLTSGKTPFSFRSNYRAVTVPMQAGNNMLLIQMKVGGNVQKLQVRLTDHEDIPLNFRGDENSLWQPVAK